MDVNEVRNESMMAINQNLFFMLLNNLKIEEAIEKFILDDVEIDYMGKQRFILKAIWIRYLKKVLLNRFTKVVHFKIEALSEKRKSMAFKIFMICKKNNDTFEFTEVRIVNNWKENYINKTQCQLISH